MLHSKRDCAHWMATNGPLVGFKTQENEIETFETNKIDIILKAHDHCLCQASKDTLHH